MPRVEFTLSFENYMSWRGGAPITPRTKIVTKIAATGVALVCLGFLFVLKSPDSIPPSAVLEILVGICMVVLSVPLRVVVEKPNRQNGVAVHKQIYQYYFAEPRVLEFDEHVLTYTYGTSRNSFQWKDLNSVSERNGLIILRDRFAEYMVRGSALSEDVRKELIERCEKGLGWELAASIALKKVSALDYHRARTGLRWRRETKRMVSLYLIGIVAASLFGFILSGVLSISELPIIVVLLFLIPLFEIAVTFRKFRSEQGQYNYESATFSATSICLRDQWRLWKLHTEWFEDWRETSREFRLYSWGAVYLFPKQNLRREQIDQLWEVFASIKSF